MHVSRRKVAAASIALLAGSNPSNADAADQPYADPTEASQWMDEVIAKSTRAPNGALRLSRFVEPMWFLTAPIGWRPNPGQERLSDPFTVPSGFVTDLASIP